MHFEFFSLITLSAKAQDIIAFPLAQKKKYAEQIPQCLNHRHESLEYHTYHSTIFSKSICSLLAILALAKVAFIATR